MTVDDIDTVVKQVLTESLGPYGFESAEVEFGLDHEGDEALFILAHFRPTTMPVSERPTAKAMGLLRKKLLDDGEIRFPYLSFSFPDEDVLLDEATASD